MKSRLFRNRTWVVFLTILFSTTKLFAQSRIVKPSAPKGIFKNGRYYFYNSLFTHDTTKNSQLNSSASLVFSCVNCTLNSHAKSTITAGSIVLYITSRDATCGYGSGSIIIEAANGTPPYSYTVDGYTSLSGNFPVEGSGVHNITVADASGQSTSTTVTLTDIFPGPVLIPYTIKAYPSTCSVNDGSVQLDPVGGTPPYSYSLDLVNFQSGNIFSNLYSGVYQLYVKDANGCIGQNTVFLFNGGCDALGGSWGGMECGNNAVVSVTDLNILNNGPFMYSLDGINYQSSGDFNQIGYGVQQFFIKDKNGKVQIFGFNVAENCNLKIDYIAVSAACMQADGSLQVSAADGAAPYEYTIDGISYQSRNTFTNLSPGNYFITVRDANGIKSSLPAVVYDRCPVVRAVSSPETCLGNDGSITAAGFKGTPPYLYSIDGTNFQTDNNFGGLSSGTYQITIKDALGFTGIFKQVIANSCLQVQAAGTPSNCGMSNGTIIATADLGTPPYEFSTDAVLFQTSGTFTGLKAGFYSVTVKDASGLTSSVSVTISDLVGPDIQATVQAATCANNDGLITVTTTSTDAPFLYAIGQNAYQGNNTFSALDTGEKTIRIKDKNGCVGSVIKTLSLANNLSVDAGNDTLICEGESAILKGNSNGITFSWTPSGSAGTPNSLRTNASPTISTKYYLNAILGICVLKDSVMVNVNTAPIADAGSDISICSGKSTKLHGQGGLTYLWSPVTFLDDPHTSNPFVSEPLTSQIYHLTVTDANNCKSINQATVHVFVIPPPELFAGNDTSVLKNQTIQLHAVDVNGTGFSNYNWSPGSGLDNPLSASPKAKITGDVTYGVTAISPEGCASRDSIRIKAFEVSDIYVPNAFTPNGDGVNEVLRPLLIGIKELVSFNVYNRWGQIIFATKNSGQGWDGKINGIPQQSGTFVWMAVGIDFNGNRINRKGSAILIR